TAPARTPAVGTASMANTVDAASQRGVNTRETPLRSTLHDSAPAMPASARPRGELVAEAPAAEQLSGEHESSGSEHGNAQRERSERRAAVSDQSSSWSTNAGGSTTATRAESAATVVKDGVAARQPEEAPKLAQPTSHVTLQLDKDTLGASRIRVAVRGDTVRATILAEDGKVAALTAQLPELRRALEERGFTQARVTIQVEGHQEHQGNVIAGAMTDDLRAKPAASTRADQGRDEQQPRGGRRQDPDGDRPRDRRRQTPDEETE
ncbi:MAG: flagellar hook-length control protein FliK, partial [Gemmatimonadales bacterium]